MAQKINLALESDVKKDKEEITKNISENTRTIKVDAHKKAPIDRTECKVDDFKHAVRFEIEDGVPVMVTTLAEGHQGTIKPASDLITSKELADKVGYTAPTLPVDFWIRHVRNGKVIYVANKNIVANANIGQLMSKNLIYGDKVIEIKNKKYKIRVLRGISEEFQPDPKKNLSNSGIAGSSEIYHNSEWNSVFCPISENAPNNWVTPANVTENYVLQDITYASNVLDFEKSSLCQEYFGVSGHKCTRGGSVNLPQRKGSCPSPNNIVDTSRHTAGWRPVLELVEE